MPLFPKLIFIAGTLVDMLATHNAALPREPLPVLKTKDGNSRRVPKGNKLILLDRMKEQRRHRSEVMRSHSELSSSQIGLIRHEQLLVVTEFLGSRFGQSFFFTFGNLGIGIGFRLYRGLMADSVEAP